MAPLPGRYQRNCAEACSPSLIDPLELLAGDLAAAGRVAPTSLILSSIRSRPEATGGAAA